jgi:hypothetical protein
MTTSLGPLKLEPLVTTPPENSDSAMKLPLA